MDSYASQFVGECITIPSLWGAHHYPQFVGSASLSPVNDWCIAWSTENRPTADMWAWLNVVAVDGCWEVIMNGGCVVAVVMMLTASWLANFVWLSVNTRWTAHRLRHTSCCRPISPGWRCLVQTTTRTPSWFWTKSSEFCRYLSLLLCSTPVDAPHHDTCCYLLSWCQ